MRFLSRLFLASYRFMLRVQDKVFSLLISGAFAGFGRRSVISLPVRLSGEDKIRIGDRVYFGAGCWLQALDEGGAKPEISIGSGCSFAGYTVISGVREIRIEKNVLVARNVYISDHMHKYADPNLPVLAQGLERIRPVHICEGAWLGENVVVCPGATIGAGAVIGANSVVNSDIPAHAVAVGAPARILPSRPARALAAIQ